MGRQVFRPDNSATIAALFLGLSTVSSLNAGELTVRIKGLPSDAGFARIVLVDSGLAYAGNSDPIAIASVPIENGKASWNAGPFSAGRYAVIAYHDSDADDQLDRPAFGLPFEPYGFSRSAWKTFGVPDWNDTSFQLSAAPRTENVTLRMNPVAAAFQAIWAGFPALALVCAGLGLLTISRRLRRRQKHIELSNSKGDLS